MSRFGHWVHRVVHGVEGQLHRSTHQFEGFLHREVRQIETGHKLFIRNVEHGAKRSVVYTVKVSPYITAVAAFIVNLIPVLGWVVSALIVALGTEVNRWTGYLAGRYQGMSVHDAHAYGRTISRRNLTAGSIGSVIGGILSAAGVALTAGASAAGEGAALSAADGGELAYNSAEVGAGFSAAETSADVEWLPGAVQGAYEAGPGAAEVPVGTQLGASTGQGFFGKAWDWAASNPDKIVTGLGGAYQQLKRQMAQQTGFAFSFAGAGGGGVDPGGPGPGSGGVGGGWDEAADAAVGFFEEYGVMLAAGLALVCFLVLFLG